MFNNFFAKLFARQKWETLYMTQDVEQYARIKGILLDKNIVSKTKFINQNTGSISSRGHYGRSGNMTTYEILVKEEDSYSANQVIHQD